VRRAGARPRANGSRARRARKAKSSGGANRKIAFDGLIAIEYPAASPAAAAACHVRESRARRQKYAAISSATVEGKSGTVDSPSTCGSVSSVYFWW
jgi:hypothetical protein